MDAAPKRRPCDETALFAAGARVGHRVEETFSNGQRVWRCNAPGQPPNTVPTREQALRWLEDNVH